MPTEDDGGTLRFASRVIGSMGASISMGPEGSLVGVSCDEGEQEEPGTRFESASEGHVGSGTADGCDEIHV